MYASSNTPIPFNTAHAFHSTGTKTSPVSYLFSCEVCMQLLLLLLVFLSISAKEWNIIRRYRKFSVAINQYVYIYCHTSCWAPFHSNTIVFIILHVSWIHQIKSWYRKLHRIFIRSQLCQLVVFQNSTQCHWTHVNHIAFRTIFFSRNIIVQFFHPISRIILFSFFKLMGL